MIEVDLIESLRSSSGALVQRSSALGAAVTCNASTASRGTGTGRKHGHKAAGIAQQRRLTAHHWATLAHANRVRTAISNVVRTLTAYIITDTPHTRRCFDSIHTSVIVWSRAAAIGDTVIHLLRALMDRKDGVSDNIK